MTSVSASLQIAAVQLSSQDSPSENLEKVANLVRAAAQAGARLVVLPENFAYMGNEVTKRAVAEPLNAEGPIQAAIRSLCVSERVSILAGGFPERSPDADRPYNTSALFDARGELVCAYRKLHLFDVDLRSHGSLAESRTTSPGNEVVVGQVDEFRVGLSICYDLRFPELFRALVDRGAEILTVPAAFTLYTGKDHWHVLLRARAIETQCYVVAAAQWGRHPENRTTFGHALIADPWGTVIAECSDREGFALARVERSFIDEVRGRIPCRSHRRLPL